MYFIKKMIGSSLSNNLVDMSVNVSHHASVLDF